MSAWIGGHQIIADAEHEFVAFRIDDIAIAVEPLWIRLAQCNQLRVILNQIALLPCTVPIEPVKLFGGIVRIRAAEFGTCELLAGQHERDASGGKRDTHSQLVGVHHVGQRGRNLRTDTGQPFRREIGVIHDFWHIHGIFVNTFGHGAAQRTSRKARAQLVPQREVVVRGHVLNDLACHSFRMFAATPRVHGLTRSRYVLVHATVHITRAVREEHMALDGVSRGVAEVADATVKLRQA